MVAPDGAVAGVDVRGAAPGTRETDLLHPVNTVDTVHAIVLSGGSAFGLATAHGVMQVLARQGRGILVGGARVPIVPAAVLFDLDSDWTSTDYPDAKLGETAFRQAHPGRVTEGSVGAGAGATIGKASGRHRATKGGLGSTALRAGPLVVGAVAAVNALGEVLASDGSILAGVRGDKPPDWLDSVTLMTADPLHPFHHGHTTLAIVATNASLTKPEVTRVATMAHDGLARAIRPAHTGWDGDTIFAVAGGSLRADASIVGMLAADAVATAIRKGISAAVGWADLPSRREWLGFPNPSG